MLRSRHHLFPKRPWTALIERARSIMGLPSTLVITAENDVLRDEGEAFAHALAEAGGDATAVRHAGATHGFFGWYHAAAPSRAAVELAGAWLRSKLG